MCSPYEPPPPTTRTSIYARYFFEIEDIIVRGGYHGHSSQPDGDKSSNRSSAKRRVDALNMPDAFRMEAVSSAVEARYKSFRSPLRQDNPTGQLLFFSANTDPTAMGGGPVRPRGAGGRM